jgi:hypothetical protein
MIMPTPMLSRAAFQSVRVSLRALNFNAWRLIRLALTLAPPGRQQKGLGEGPFAKVTA